VWADKKEKVFAFKGRRLPGWEDSGRGALGGRGRTGFLGKKINSQTPSVHELIVSGNEGSAFI